MLDGISEAMRGSRGGVEGGRLMGILAVPEACAPSRGGMYLGGDRGWCEAPLELVGNGGVVGGSALVCRKGKGLPGLHVDSRGVAP